MSIENGQGATYNAAVCIVAFKDVESLDLPYEDQMSAARSLQKMFSILRVEPLSKKTIQATAQMQQSPPLSSQVQAAK